VEEMDLGSVFDSEMIEDDVIPALEMAMLVINYRERINPEENPGSNPPYTQYFTPNRFLNIFRRLFQTRVSYH
jgi:hypothetical protein